MSDTCPECGPALTCGRCGQKFPHSRNECDLVQTHELEMFGLKVVIEATIKERGAPNMRDLDGPLEHSVSFAMKVEGAGGISGASSRTIEHGVDWLYEQAKQHRAEEQAHYAAEREAQS